MIKSKNTKKNNSIKVYISGPMSGYEDFNFPAFMEMEKKLSEIENVIPVNPVYISKSVEREMLKPNYEDYLKKDIEALLHCNAVILLDDWEKSRGCNIEVAVAGYFNIPCFKSIDEVKNFKEK